MGGAVAACLTANGHRPHWVAAGRSDASRRRAEAAGALGHPDLESALVACAQSSPAFVLSICPPDNALEVADQVAKAAAVLHDPAALLFVDANAVAPVTVRAVAAIVAKAGVGMVDGGLVGPPPSEGGSTRLYLSGPRAEDVAGLFTSGALSAVEIDGGIGAASALKMVFAAWTKGSAALMLEVAAAAKAHGVYQPLLAEWAISRPQMAAQVERAAGNAAPKAWRWKGEMEEIAATMAEKGLPAGMPLGAAEIFRRLGEFKDRAPAPSLDEVLDVLLA